ncbi:twitching motility protein PilT [Candidatus Magnetoovum chiemensis]|nr:twitching motility protein PilT [Candidatus Magnetoovum chiemensis]
MRDLETMQLALTAAETGHLVFTTVHANNATEAVDRIVSAFPSDRQSMVRVQLSQCMIAAIFQALIPTKDKKSRVCAVEILIGTPAVRNLIREEKTFQLPSVIQTGMKEGMQSLDQHLRQLLMKNIISQTEAAKYAQTKNITQAQQQNIGGPKDG